MGILWLKFLFDVLSCFIFKLEEVFYVFILVDEWDECLVNGMYVVDFGVCLGGWIYQLVKCNMWVFLVDNGLMVQSLMDIGQVIWLCEDGFCYCLNCNNILWMVCDMVEKLVKVVVLMVQWLVNGWCWEIIFNFKLLMKKCYEEVLQNLVYIQVQLDEYGVNVQIQVCQLYYDCEEVIVYVCCLWVVVGGCCDEC